MIGNHELIDRQQAEDAGLAFHHQVVQVFEQVEQPDGPPVNGAFLGTRIELVENATDAVRYSSFAKFELPSDAHPETGRFATLKKVLGRQANDGYTERLENRTRRMAIIGQRFNSYRELSSSEAEAA